MKMQGNSQSDYHQISYSYYKISKLHHPYFTPVVSSAAWR